MEKVQTITNTALEGEYSVLQTAEGDGKSRKEAKYSKFPINRQIVREINRREDLVEYKEATRQGIIIAMKNSGLPLEAAEGADLLFSNSELLPEAWNNATTIGKRIICFVCELVYNAQQQGGAIAKAPKQKAKIDTQLSIFTEIRQAQGEGVDLPYNPWIWAQEVYDKKAPATTEIRNLRKEVDKLCTKFYALPDGQQYIVAPLLEKRDKYKLTPGANAAQIISVHPALVQHVMMSKHGAIKGAKPFCLFPKTRNLCSLNKNVDMDLLFLLADYYTSAWSAIEKAQAAGKEEPHTEFKEDFLGKLYRGNKRDLSLHRGRIEAAVESAFEKMMLPEIGLIKPNSFKSEKGKYSWIWNPGYRKGK